MTDILNEIVEHKKAELKEVKKLVPYSMLKDKIGEMPETRDFRNAIYHTAIRIIAEVKKASPSRGVLCPDFKPVELARTYQQEGAAAISILTETRYFQGKLEYLKEIRLHTSIPLLRKDFIFEPYQVYESRVAGADAILLIAAILSRQQLAELLEISSLLELDCLVEVHNESEVKNALDCGADIIGINNRNLKTFVTDIGVTCNLRRLIPGNIAVVSESGIHGKDEIDALKRQHINAILIGEALVTADNTAAKLGEMRKLLA